MFPLDISLNVTLAEFVMGVPLLDNLSGDLVA